MHRYQMTTLLAIVIAFIGALPSSGQRSQEPTAPAPAGGRFVEVRGTDLVRPDGGKLLIKGTNLGNWLNPEGYMFGLKRTNAPWMIDLMLREMVGPDFVDDFWAEFKDRYITRRDIEFIASQGANTIRLPLNYKLFTDMDYMGLTARQDGFERIDSVVRWCRDWGLYLILEMHDCPGGQTGDNIDDGYGYPWLFESARSQRQLADIWRMIARRYRDEPVILGYELMNEPIAHYFDNREELNALLEPLYKDLTAAVREVDQDHIIILGGAQWNGSFHMFSDWTFDDKIVYSCHRYGGGSTQEAFQSFIDFRDRTGLPMFMGETGHNTDEWQEEVAAVLEENNIGYTFWPYKKLDDGCMLSIERPAGWDSVVVAFSEAPRGTFEEIRSARPDQELARGILSEYLDNLSFDKCRVQDSYIQSMRLDK